MAYAGRGERERERVTDRVVKIDLVLAHDGQRFGLGLDFAHLACTRAPARRGVQWRRGKMSCGNETTRKQSLGRQG
jgi:hypothetical protein